MRVQRALRDRFSGVDRLYGSGTVERLSRARVAVVGVGGVGSWAAEALARSGVGALALFDADEVCLGNSNRQSHALTPRVGQPKVEVVAGRLREVNPLLEVEAVQSFVTARNLRELVTARFDLVLDACDAFRTKVDLIVHCKRNRIAMVVSGAAGGRTDPTQIRVRDLSKTSVDVLLAQVRRKLRDEFGWTRNPKRYFGVPAVYSLEAAQYPQPDGSVCDRRPVDGEAGLKLDCGEGLGAAMHVTASFGMVAVARALQKLLGRN